MKSDDPGLSSEGMEAGEGVVANELEERLTTQEAAGSTYPTLPADTAVIPSEVAAVKPSKPKSKQAAKESKPTGRAKRDGALNLSVIDPSARPPRQVVGFGAGAGVGTLFLIYANTLPDTDPLKQYLQLAAPSVTVFLVGVWNYLTRAFWWLSREIRMRMLFRRLRRTINRGLDDRRTSQEHRDKLLLDLEELDRFDVDSQRAALKALKNSH